MPAALNTMAVATASLRMMVNAFPPLGRGSSAASQKTILHARYGKSSVPYHIASTPLARNTCLLFLVAALRVLGLEDRHRPGRLRENNRAENSHLPIRRRERKMQGLKSLPSAQRFLTTHAKTAEECNILSAARSRSHRLCDGYIAGPFWRTGLHRIRMQLKKFGSGRAGAKLIVVASRASTREYRLLCMADQAKPKGTKTS